MKKNSSFLVLVPLVAVAGVVALFQNKTFLFIFLALAALIVGVVVALVVRARRASPETPAAPSASPASAPAASPAGRVVLSKLDVKKSKEVLALSDFCVIDTETTGLSAYDKIIEISILRVSGGAVVDEYSTFVDPERTISPQAAAVNHITEAMLTGAPKYPDVAPRVAALLDGSTVLGHNVSFDLGFVARMLDAAGISASMVWLDTVELARAAVPGLENYKLQTLLAHFGIDPGHAHRAVDDTRATLELFERCRAEYPKTQKRLAAERKAARQQAEVEKAARFSASPLFDKRFSFSGEFDAGRRNIESMPDSVGAITTASVSGKTDFLVVGPRPDPRYKYDQHKMDKYNELHAAGKNIQLLNEAAFLSMIENARRVLDGSGHE